MEQKHPLGDLMSATMQKIREMVDVNTIVGQPIQTPDGITIIPVSKVSFGFASGGSDFTTKSQQPGKDNCFGGGGGAGVNILPIGFLVIKGDSVRMLPVAPPPGNTADRVIEMVPDLVDKVSGFLKKKEEGGAPEGDTVEF